MSEFLAEHGIRLIWLLLLLVGSAFFSGSETALFCLSRHQLESFRQGRNVFGRLVARLMDRPEQTIVTVILGNMTINVLFFAIASVLALSMTRTAPRWESTVVALLPLLAIIFFGEVLPKTVAVAYPVGYATVVAVPLYAFDRVIWPIRVLLQRLLVQPSIRLLTKPSDVVEPVGADELAELLQRSAAQGLLQANENLLLQEVIELGSIRVGEVATPWLDVIRADIAADPKDVLDLAGKAKVKRIPLYQDEPDNVVGLLHVRDLLLHLDRSLADLARPVWYVPEIKRIDGLLEDFRNIGRQTALLVDEYGSVTGLVTLEDVVEELVGNVFEEGEAPEELVREQADGCYLVSGQLSIREWSQAFGLAMTERRINTIAGLINAKLGRIASVGDGVTLRNLRLEVTKVHRHRIVEVRIHRLAASPDDQPKGGLTG